MPEDDAWEEMKDHVQSFVYCWGEWMYHRDFVKESKDEYEIFLRKKT